MQLALASAARSRLETIFRRGFPVVASILLLEAMVNMFAQLPHLNLFSHIYVAVLGSLIGNIFYVSWRSDAYWPILLFASVVAVSILIWPAFVTQETFPASYQPWIWWTLGIAGVGAALTLPVWAAASYLFFTSILWIFLHTSENGGGADISNALQDSSYLFLIGNSFLAVIWLIRNSANKVDEANSEAVKREIERARIDAIERERQRLDALVHDRVLNALLTAAKAGSEKDQVSAAALAKEAIDSLKKARNDEPSTEVNPAALFHALEIAALRLSENVKVDVKSATLMNLPSETASALTEATLQALDNALRHSDANNVELELAADDSNGIEIQVRDDGRGFRPDRISRNRIGLRTSIFARAESVGATVTLNTKVGQGTSIKMRWKK